MNDLENKTQNEVATKRPYNLRVRKKKKMQRTAH